MAPRPDHRVHANDAVACQRDPVRSPTSTPQPRLPPASRSPPEPVRMGISSRPTDGEMSAREVRRQTCNESRPWSDRLLIKPSERAEPASPPAIAGHINCKASADRTSTGLRSRVTQESRPQPRRHQLCQPAAGLGTAFIPRPNELGADQTKDLTAEGDWDLVCTSILDLARRFAEA